MKSSESIMMYVTKICECYNKSFSDYLSHTKIKISVAEAILND